MTSIKHIAYGLKMTSKVRRAVQEAYGLAKTFDTTEIWKRAWPPHTHGMSRPGTIRAWAGVVKRAILDPIQPIPDCPVVVCAETQTEAAAVQGVVEALTFRGIKWCTWGTQPTPQNTPLFVGKSARERMRQSILVWMSMLERTKHNAKETYQDSVYTTAETLLALSGKRTRALLLSNTHSTFPSHAIETARALGLKTIYVQHAPTHNLLPALNVDVACLDGQASFEAYRSIAERDGYTQRPLILLTGKRDLPKMAQGHDTGVAFNSLDDIHKVTTFLRNQPKHAGALVFRHHPGMDAAELEPWRNLAANMGAVWSDPTQESAERYAEKLHTLYAGATGLILQAAFAGVACKQWIDPTHGQGDHYAFQRWGICAGPEETARKANPTALAQWSSTYATPAAGSESAWVAALVAQVVEQGSMNPKSLGFHPVDHGDGWNVWIPPTTPSSKGDGSDAKP